MGEDVAYNSGEIESRNFRSNTKKVTEWRNAQIESVNKPLVALSMHLRCIFSVDEDTSELILKSIFDKHFLPKLV